MWRSRVPERLSSKEGLKGDTRIYLGTGNRINSLLNWGTGGVGNRRDQMGGGEEENRKLGERPGLCG